MSIRCLELLKPSCGQERRKSEDKAVMPRKENGKRGRICIFDICDGQLN